MGLIIILIVGSFIFVCLLGGIEVITEAVIPKEVADNSTVHLGCLSDVLFFLIVVPVFYVLGTTLEHWSAIPLSIALSLAIGIIICSVVGRLFPRNK